MRSQGGALFRDAARDGGLAAAAGNERGIHGINRDEIAEQRDGGIGLRNPAEAFRSRKFRRHNRVVNGTTAPALARDIAVAVRDAGGRALIVGGWVRDLLRRRPSKDVDIEVFGVPQDRLPSLLAPLGRVEPVGQSFPVYKVVRPGHGEGAVDVALPRRESKSGRGHKGFEVHGDPSMSFEDAARRRDFTVNAIA